MYFFNGTRKVIVPREEVEAFRDSWPGNNLRDRSYWFEFDENGDLVDTDVPEHDDGDAAAALSQEAQAFMEENYENHIGVEDALKLLGDLDVADNPRVAYDFLVERGVSEEIAELVVERFEEKTVRTSEFEAEFPYDEHPDLSHLEQTDEEMGEGFEESAQERLAGYENGSWEMVGVVATVTAPDGMTFSSAGLWGIESDSGRPYLMEVFAEQVEELAKEMEGQGYYVVRDGVNPYAADSMRP